MKVAVIGSGNVGRALAGAAVRAGHEVSVSASRPERAGEAAAATGARAANSNRDAVADAEVVILAVPAGAAGEVVRELGPALDGKAVADATNRVNVQQPATVLDGTSTLEVLQGLAPNAHLVKAFNTIFATVMADPTVEGRPVDTYLAGDSPAAKATVAELAASMGFRPIDAGTAPMARVLEGMALLNISLQVAHGWPWRSSWRLEGPTARPAPAAD